MYHREYRISRRRTILAFLVAPLAIPVGLALLFEAFPDSPPRSLTGFFLLVALFAYIAFPPAFLYELTVGFPLWLFLRRRGFLDWPTFMVCGTALGTVYFFALSIVDVLAQARGYDIYSHSLANYWLNPMALWIDTPGGCASAMVFRAILSPKETPRIQSSPQPSDNR